MIRKILCWLGLHKWELNLVRCNVDGPESIMNYDEQTDSVQAWIFLNIECKHCKKHLGSRVIRASCPAKEVVSRRAKR